MIQNLLAATREPFDLVRRLARERTPDIVDALNAESREETLRILSAMPDERAVEVFDTVGLLALLLCCPSVVGIGAAARARFRKLAADHVKEFRRCRPVSRV